jgi:DNA-binding transcriptional LysR family regulator
MMRDGLDLRGIDLNMLPKFRALYRHRSVSEAGRELHLTQSALSNALAKMRSLFGDELFVRTPTGMEPTSFAHTIAEPIERALVHLETDFVRLRGFAPEHSARTFRIAMTQLGEVWLAPQILSFARTVAPDIVVSNVTAGDRGFEGALSAGSIDFAVGHLPELGVGFRDQELGVHQFVCVLRGDHPVLREPLTLHALMSCTFVDIVENDTPYGRAIMRLVRSDAMRYRTANILALPNVIAATDLVAVMPAWFAARFTNMNLKLVRILPEPYVGTIRLFWHENYEHDPGHLWMRSLIARAANVANVEESLNDVEIITVVSEGAAANGDLSKRALNDRIRDTDHHL